VGRVTGPGAPRGVRALQSELARKGIDRGITDVVLEEREDAKPGADTEVARRVLARHERTLARVADPRVRRQRAYALLAPSDFHSETATEVIAPEIARDTD
jgi:SOS response regulatory protein OraA/RecX